MQHDEEPGYQPDGHSKLVNMRHPFDTTTAATRWHSQSDCGGVYLAGVTMGNLASNLIARQEKPSG